VVTEDLLLEEGHVVTPAELHAWVVAQWQAKLDVARAATTADGRSWARSFGGPTLISGFVVGLSPAFAVAVCEAALRRLERHEPDGTAGCDWCREPVPGTDGIDEACFVPWPCPEVLDDASPFADRPDFPEELRRR
jgi:hypothetical protein